MRLISPNALALCAACVALLLPGASGAQDDIDLDELPPQQLDYLLHAELDDVYERLDSNSLYKLNVLVDAIMYALSDHGDDDDEQTIDIEDLIEETNEAGVTLRAIVIYAVRSADEHSGNGRGGIIPVVREDRQRTAPSPGFAAPVVALPKVKLALTETIRRVNNAPPARRFP